MKKIQIILPAINLWEKYTRACIDSIQTAMVSARAHDIECRVLFIDNASTDQTLIEAGKRVSDRFAHKRNEERWGFQKSVNYGVNDAWGRGYDYALVCNNDTLLHPEALWRLVEGFEKEREEDIGMVTCMDVRGETSPSMLAVMSTKEKEACQEAPNPNFSAFMIDRECWEDVGEMDEVFAPAYFEDNDYHYRMKLTGKVAIVYPPALFYHYGSATQNEAQENGQPMVPSPAFEANRNAYAKKWGGVPCDEKFEHPYNDDGLSVRSTQQNTVA